MNMGRLFCWGSDEVSRKYSVVPETAVYELRRLMLSRIAARLGHSRQVRCCPRDVDGAPPSVHGPNREP